MTQYITNLGKSVLSMFPQNAHGKKVTELDKQALELKGALNEKTGAVFQDKLKETTVFLQNEKAKCYEGLDRLNGAYYQDPASLLKKAWDSLVTKVQTALGICVQSRNELDTLLETDLKNPDTKEKKLARYAINAFCQLEKKRDGLEKQLSGIIATEKTGLLPVDAAAQKPTFEARYLALCGSYFQDPRGLLDQAWNMLQEAKTNDPSSVESLSAEFDKLEAERKQLEAKIYRLNQQQNIPPSTDRSYENLTIDSITEELRLTEEAKTAESSQSGVDWKKTAMATKALTTAFLAAGFYIVTTDLI